MRQYQPIHALLHTATTTSDTHVNLVHTLRGLAWRIQASPRSPKKPATLPSAVSSAGRSLVVSYVMGYLLRAPGPGGARIGHVRLVACRGHDARSH